MPANVLPQRAVSLTATRTLQTFIYFCPKERIRAYYVFAWPHGEDLPHAALQTLASNPKYWNKSLQHPKCGPKLIPVHAPGRPQQLSFETRPEAEKAAAQQHASQHRGSQQR